MMRYDLLAAVAVCSTSDANQTQWHTALAEANAALNASAIPVAQGHVREAVNAIRSVKQEPGSNGEGDAEDRCAPGKPNRHSPSCDAGTLRSRTTTHENVLRARTDQ